METLSRINRRNNNWHKRTLELWNVVGTMFIAHPSKLHFPILNKIRPNIPKKNSMYHHPHILRLEIFQDRQKEIRDRNRLSRQSQALSIKWKILTMLK